MTNVLDVPYVKQVTNWSCAVASLEMVAKYYGTAIDQAEIYERLKCDIGNGQLAVKNIDLIAEANRLGFDALHLNFNYTSADSMFEQLREHIIKNETPLIATQKSSATSQLGHSRVIIGLQDQTPEDERRLVCFHDPSNHFQNGCPPGGPGRKWKAQDFANMWKPNAQTPGGAAILIRPRTNS